MTQRCRNIIPFKISGDSHVKRSYILFAVLSLLVLGISPLLSQDSSSSGKASKQEGSDSAASGEDHTNFQPITAASRHAAQKGEKWLLDAQMANGSWA